MSPYAWLSCLVLTTTPLGHLERLQATSNMDVIALLINGLKHFLHLYSFFHDLSIGVLCPTAFKIDILGPSLRQEVT